MNVSGLLGSTLIDSGATHSFINPSFAKKVGKTSMRLDSWFSVATPIGAVMQTNSVLKGCPLEVNGQLLSADLIILDIRDFDVILGMDWLEKYHAAIDCHKKMVVFRPPEKPEFTFTRMKGVSSVPFISAMKARRMINKGCTCYLALVSKTPKDELTVDQVSIVHEFVDVFPQDLPSIPPNREIDFVIDLVPGTEPISKAPYRMGPGELKELKTQLEELLNNGFI